MGVAMSRFVILINVALFLLYAGAAHAGTLGDLVEEGGFVDARLGDPVESFAGLQRIGADQEARTETYIRNSDTFTVGSSRVDSVTYSFYDGRLYFISVQTAGRENAEAVLAELESTYGEGIETGNGPNEHIWTSGNVFVVYDLDEATGRGMTAMTSAPIHAQMRMERNATPARIDYGF
jgi:hypothetical protein